MLSSKLLNTKPDLDKFIRSWMDFLQKNTTKYQTNMKIMKKIDKLFIAINFFELNISIYYSCKTYSDIIKYNQEKARYNHDNNIYDYINIMIKNQETKEYVL